MISLTVNYGVILRWFPIGLMLLLTFFSSNLLTAMITPFLKLFVSIFILVTGSHDALLILGGMYVFDTMITFSQFGVFMFSELPGISKATYLGFSLIFPIFAYIAFYRAGVI